MEMTIPKSYAVFDLKVREFLKNEEKRDSAMRVISTAILRELTFLNDGDRRKYVYQNGISYHEVLTNLVSEIVMDELGRQHSQTEEANTDGDRK
mgnify:FL=1